MTFSQPRRRMVHLSLASVPALLGLSHAHSALAQGTAATVAGGTGSRHDFDFFFGSWQISYRRLKRRLANNHEWEEYGGSTVCQPLLDGLVNINDTVIHRPGGPSRGLGLRAFDPKTNTWADWYLDARAPTQLDPPGLGRFNNGIGTFLSEDQFDGKPILVRGIFTPLTPSSMQWEQAFSPDAGTTWETNLVLRYTRTG